MDCNGGCGEWKPETITTYDSPEFERSVEYWKAKAMMYREETKAIQRCLDKKKHYIRRLTNDILHMKAKIADIILRYAPNDGGVK